MHHHRHPSTVVSIRHDEFLSEESGNTCTCVAGVDDTRFEDCESRVAFRGGDEERALAWEDETRMGEWFEWTTGEFGSRGVGVGVGFVVPVEACCVVALLFRSDARVAG